MLSIVRLVDQWQHVQARLPEDWTEAQLQVTLWDAGHADRAAALLAPLAPTRRARRLRFACARRGAGPGPGTVRRLLGRLDGERIAGTLELVAAAGPAAASSATFPPLASAWEAERAALAPDWSDLYGEVDLASSDYVERGALLLAPLNPTRYGDRTLRFRCARSFGYGAAPELVGRCLERLDADGIRGRLRVLWALSDTRAVATQGPVWHVGGKPV